MAKRKAGVNDIIYELDNDDIVISSDEEGKESKIGRFDKDNNKKNYEKKLMKEEILTDFINLDSPNEPERNITPPNKNEIGGKNKSKITSKQNSTVNTEMNITINDDVIDITDNKIKSCQNTIIYNDEIVVDSPASNTDLGVVGCENRSPLVSIRFKDNFLAHNYKKRIKEFIVTLLKAKNDIQSDSETDNELEIWPEDLVEEEFDKTIENPLEDNLFFLDTTPSNDMHKDIPVYHKATNILSNVTEKEATPQTLKRGFTCFNCEGSHLLRDCPLPRDNAKINVKRKAYTPRPGRYHVEDEQKYGHLIPGRISGDLRHALGLKRHELPLHIYRMRLLGYPPGWLEEARISHSGITLFDSSGRATLDPDEEEGEVCEPGSKDKFDIKKILDFPGFNVIASSRYAEEAHLYGLPEMSEQDSKIAMLQILAPNAMKAYKRKKLSFFPSASKNLIEEGQAEMELDSGDEVTEFPSIPPLPDDEPPAPPPPPPPATEDIKEESNKDGETLKHIDQSDNENPPNNVHNASGVLDKLKCDSNIDSDGSSDLEVIEVVRVNDIPIPEDDLITIDDDDKSSLSSGRNSPSLDDLEKRKQRLLDALKGDSISVTEVSIENNVDEVISNTAKENKTPEENQVKHAVATEENTNAKSEPDKEESEVKSEAETVSNPTSINETQSVNKVQVKNIVYGTPVINVASPFQKIPSSDKFAKDICDVINFENLPNSVGKYKKICKLLKKVKSEVDRIQDS